MMGKMNDKVILGLLCGLLGNLPKAIINETLVRKGIEKKRFAEIVAGLFVTPEEATSKKGIAFGFLGDFATASFLGIPLVYLLSKTGKNHKIIKGGMMGLAGLGIYRGIIAQLGNKGTYPTDVTTNVSMSVTSTLWGITAGILATSLGHESLFKPSQARNSLLNKERRDEQQNDRSLSGRL